MKIARCSSLFLLITVGVFFVSCETKPKRIDYGKINCRYCKMTVVDKIHASEIVTKKGRVYVFDSAECMIHFIRTFDTSKIKVYLTNTYDHPELLSDATKSAFLVSKKLPSPMGEFLTVFKDLDSATKVQKKMGGDLYTWKEITTHLK